MLTLAEDPVPNIRFNVSQSIAGIYLHCNASNREKLCQALQKMAASDTDFDSKFFAQKTLDTVTGKSSVEQ